MFWDYTDFLEEMLLAFKQSRSPQIEYGLLIYANSFRIVHFNDL